MTLANTTYLTCDATINGKPCGRIFALPDDPRKNTPGVEHTVSLTIGALNKTFHFCNMEHLLRFALDWLRASRNPKPESRAHVATEELESIPPNMPMESLKLEDN